MHLTLPVVDTTVTLVPVLGLAGSIPGVWIVHVGTQLPFAIFLLAIADARAPRSLIDSARLDGASHAQACWSVVVPLTTPTLAASGVSLFLGARNDHAVALTIIGASGTDFPATVRFASFGSTSDGPVVMAMVFMHLLVALAAFCGLQRSFVRGLLTGVDQGGEARGRYLRCVGSFLVPGLVAVGIVVGVTMGARSAEEWGWIYRRHKPRPPGAGIPGGVFGQALKLEVEYMVERVRPSGTTPIRTNPGLASTSALDDQNERWPLGRETIAVPVSRLGQLDAAVRPPIRLRPRRPTSRACRRRGRAPRTFGRVG